MRQYCERLELSAEETTAIRKRYRETRDRKISERLLCLLMKAEGLSHEMVGKVLGVSKGTVSRWIGLYREEGLNGLCQLSYGGDPSELFPEQMKELEAELRRRVYHNVLPNYGWAPIGERPISPSNSGRERLSLLGAYCPLDEEWVNDDTAGTINAQSVVELTDCLCALHPQAKRIVLIVDNARYNHARLVREHIAETVVEIVYLPPYSPKPDGANVEVHEEESDAQPLL